MRLTRRINTLTNLAALQQRQRDVQCFCWAIVTSLRFNAWLSALDTLWLLQNHEWISGDWQVFSAYPLMSDGQALQVGVQRTSYHCQLEASAIACLSIIEWRLGDVSALYVLCDSMSQSCRYLRYSAFYAICRRTSCS